MNFHPQVAAVALFFDDIRMEMGNKLTLVGQYAGALNLPDGANPVDRVSVLLQVRWAEGFRLINSRVKIVIPGTPPIEQLIPGIDEVKTGLRPPSPFSGNTLQGIFQLRFAPLRIGDALDVWFLADGIELPAGRLHVDPPTPA